jgi:hypothetical protein
MAGLPTGKSLGFVKGDFVLTPAFPGIIISDVHTYAPCCEVWGWEHEMGSAYAHELQKINKEQFMEYAKQYGFDGTAYSKVAQQALS